MAASPLALFGRNPRQSDRGIDRLLGLAGDAALAAKDAVLVDLEPAAQPEPADRDVVGFRSGEIVQRRAEAFRRNDAQVDLHA
jgi:hypothetical protein